jgi:ADP-ribose pyrophosphatase YjhB (NUDIX family)
MRHGTVTLSPYLQRLREMVGHELLVLPSVTVLPRDDEGRVLLVRLKSSGLWSTIGGVVEPGESPRECGVREVREEAGVTVELRQLLGVFGGPGYEHTYANGDRTCNVSVVFDASVTDGQPAPDDIETSDARWWWLEDVPPHQMLGFSKVLLHELGMRRA